MWIAIILNQSGTKLMAENRKNPFHQKKNFGHLVAPDWNFDGRRFLVRSSLVRKNTFVYVKGPFPNSAFGTVIPKQSVSNLSWVHQLILNELLKNTDYQCIWWTNVFREIVKMSHKNDSHAIFIILRNIHVGNRIESSPS